MPRSSVYAHTPHDAETDASLRSHIQRIAGAWPTYGYRLVTAQLHRESAPTNSKRVRRLIHEVELVGRVPKRRCRTTNSEHPYPRSANLVAERSD